MSKSSEAVKHLDDLHIQDEEVDMDGGNGDTAAEQDDNVDTSQPDSNTESVEPEPRILPTVNCMEKIVLCIDLSKELEECRFTLKNGQSFSGVQMMKKIVEMFIQTKHTMDPRHQFALVILTDSVVWITDFTNNTKDLCDVLADLNETTPCNSCDLTSLFSTILEKTSLPDVADPTVDPPQFVVRAVIIYGRAQTEPMIDKDNQAFQKLLASKHFFLDFLYTHPLASDDNNVQVIFDKMCDIDLTSAGYKLELTHRATKIYNKMASLLGHPLQRPPQSQTHYKIQVCQSEMCS